jgi:hypothetical protein
MSIEDMYYKDFGSSNAYESAKQILWEKHCQYPERYPWPPNLDDLKSEIESDKWSDVANR